MELMTEPIYLIFSISDNWFGSFKSREEAFKLSFLS